MLFKRKVQLAVISDVHLGTFGCHAKELLQYLNSIEPEILVLNGDIIDIWQFSKRYWPASHMMVVNHLINLIAGGTKIYYFTGNQIGDPGAERRHHRHLAIFQTLLAGFPHDGGKPPDQPDRGRNKNLLFHRQSDRRSWC